MRLRLHHTAILIGSLAASAAAFGQTVTAGSGTLDGDGKLRAESCHKRSHDGAVSAGVTRSATGDFTVTLGATTLAGTSTTDRRISTLSFDAASLLLLESKLEADASALCGAAVDLSSVTVRKAALKVNKRNTRATLRLRMDGMENGEKTREKLRLSGAWL